MVISSSTYELLGPVASRALASAIGENPANTLVTHSLLRGTSRAYAAGQPPAFRAALVEVAGLAGEPQGFADDAADLWSLLRHVEGWDCVLVRCELAGPLGTLMQQKTGRTPRYFTDVGFTLEQPVRCYSDPVVRELGSGDLGLLESAPEDLHAVVGYHDQHDALENGVVAGAIVDGRLVARACTGSLTERFADIGVDTLEEWRGRGLATAAASLVARRVQHMGRTPVWSAGVDNWASLRVAEKLGFTESGRQCYVIRT